jgi:pSer/pThr/pTyr-binding forkhead associated (FHA) protein
VDTTQLSPPDAGATPSMVAWGVLVAYHPDPKRVGARLAVTAEAPLELGRDAGLFADHTMSRRHARVVLRPSGPEVSDLNSRNGTFVNGEPVRRQALRPGDIVGVGEMLLLVLRDSSPASGALSVLTAEIAKVAPLGTPVLFSGEVGVGKSYFARALHEASGRGALVPVPCGAVPAERVAEELFGLDAAAYPPGRPGLLEQAHAGTLLLDDVDDASESLQAALLAFLENGLTRRLGASAPARVDVRVVATARSPEGLRGEFLSRLSRFVLRVPPLRERPEDVAALIRALLAPHGVWLKRGLAFALLRHDYRHNVRELASVLERATIDAGDDRMIGLSRGVADALGLGDDGSPNALAVAADGTWFRPPGAPRVSLVRRENLTRLLRTLLEARRDQAGRALTTDTLFAAGWPGERIQGPSAAGRVYVALTSLRNLGLRDFLVRSEGGYLLDAGANIESIG